MSGTGRRLTWIPGWMIITSARSQGFFYLNRAAACRIRKDYANARRYRMVAARYFKADAEGVHELTERRTRIDQPRFLRGKI